MNTLLWTLIRLAFAPGSCLAVLFDFDANHLRMTADWAVLDELLRLAARTVDGDDDLFAADVADVRRLDGRLAALAFAAFHDSVLRPQNAIKTRHANSGSTPIPA